MGGGEVKSAMKKAVTLIFLFGRKFDEEGLCAVGTRDIFLTVGLVPKEESRKFLL